MEENIKAENKQSHNQYYWKYLPVVFAILISFLITYLCLFNSYLFKNLAFSLLKIENPIPISKNIKEKDLEKEIKSSQKRIAALSKKLENYTPYEPYLIVNTTQNTFTLRTRKEIIRQSKCSTGSYTLLDAGDDKKWIFKTPKGMFYIQGKVADPVWIKPDWAFIEEGLPVPHKGSPDRYEYGTLGDYALSLGKGYLIHGTLYQRFIGLPVTHGCIRLGDEDLAEVYKNLNVGSKVFIY